MTAVSPSVRQGSYRVRTTCRGCESVELLSVLDLGFQPLANGFRDPADDGPEERFPLHLVRCRSCELVQLSAVVSPDEIYGQQYAYRSGYSSGWSEHCHALAKEIGRKRVLDVGCLDGVMLRHCRDNGCEVMGFDASAPRSEMHIQREMFGRETRFQVGQFDVLIAQNVFGHVDDAEGFLLAARHAISSDGMIVIECPWIVDLVDGVRWDTVYHEHLSYWGVRALMRLAQAAQLEISATKYFPAIHGGTMRYYLRHRRAGVVDPAVYERWRDEEMDVFDWSRFQEQAEAQIRRWTAELSDTSKRIGIYGASAKLNTFLNALSVRPSIDAIYDDNPGKIGKVTPGHRFPVVKPTTHAFGMIDLLLIGASNWRTEIEEKARDLGFRGEVRTLWT